MCDFYPKELGGEIIVRPQLILLSYCNCGEVRKTNDFRLTLPEIPFIMFRTLCSGVCFMSHGLPKTNLE